MDGGQLPKADLEECGGRIVLENMEGDLNDLVESKGSDHGGKICKWRFGRNSRSMAFDCIDPCTAKKVAKTMWGYGMLLLITAKGDL